MKLSTYCYLYSNRDKYYLYSGISNAFANISYDLYQLLKKIKKSPFYISELETEIKKSLIEAKVLVTSEEEEYYVQQKKLLRNVQNYQNSALHLTIAPTSNCNFRCPYCFEAGIQPKTMTDEMVDNVLQFIKMRSRITQNNISITWYGGEPLLAKKQINNILDFIEREKITIVDHSIITNGYLLSEVNIDWLIKRKINFIQITLDGSNPELHNRKRFLKNGKGTWDKILNNIDMLLNKTNGINISLRCNIDKSNKDDYLKLKEQLAIRWKDKNITIYPAILRQHFKQESLNCVYLTNKEAVDFLLETGLKEKNIKYFEFELGGCTATQLNAYLIGPEGELYKCWNDLGRKEKIIGYVYNNKIPNENVVIEYMTAYDSIEDKKCLKCPLFFVCDGGCQWMRIEYFKNNNK
ncbi:MAG: radical SAM/SPASM domain Clo7bot peptide maturase [Bacteroidales bacterium]